MFLAELKHETLKWFQQNVTEQQMVTDVWQKELFPSRLTEGSVEGKSVIEGEAEVLQLSEDCEVNLFQGLQLKSLKALKWSRVYSSSAANIYRNSERWNCSVEKSKRLIRANRKENGENRKNQANCSVQLLCRTKQLPALIGRWGSADLTGRFWRITSDPLSRLFWQ